MDKNLGITTYAVSLIVKSVIMAAQFSAGRESEASNDLQA